MTKIPSMASLKTPIEIGLRLMMAFIIGLIVFFLTIRCLTVSSALIFRILFISGLVALLINLSCRIGEGLHLARKHTLVFGVIFPLALITFCLYKEYAWIKPHMTHFLGVTASILAPGFVFGFTFELLYSPGFAIGPITRYFINSFINVICVIIVIYAVGVVIVTATLIPSGAIFKSSLSPPNEFWCVDGGWRSELELYVKSKNGHATPVFTLSNRSSQKATSYAFGYLAWTRDGRAVVCFVQVPNDSDRLREAVMGFFYNFETGDVVFPTEATDWKTLDATINSKVSVHGGLDGSIIDLNFIRQKEGPMWRLLFPGD